MSRLMVPIALDALVLRSAGGAWAKTQMGVPQTPPAGAPDQFQPLLPAPFSDLPAPRPAGAYLHWALADALTALQPADDRFPPRFRPVPSRWLILRLSGTGRPRKLDGWLLPNVHDPATRVVSDILTRRDRIPVGAAPLPLTAAGFGDLGWSAYYDNVANRLGFYDPLTGVAGPVAYLVCGWYTHTSFDPLTLAAGEVASDAGFRAKLAGLGWYADGAVPSPIPTSSLFHGAAVGIAWPGTTWTGDGNGALSAESGGPPNGADVDVALAETIAAAVATVTTDDGELGLARLIEGLAQHALGALSAADGPEKLDADLHASRFGDVPQARRSETIYRPPEVLADPAAPPAPALGAGVAVRGDVHDALAATATATEPAAVADTDPEATGDLATVSRSQPRQFHPVDPVLVVEGGRRGYRHGGDGRFDSRGRLRCRYTGQTLLGLGAPGQVPPQGAPVVPTWFAVDVPAEVHDLIDEAATLDPACAPGLAAGPTPSPHAAARAAWWTTWDGSTPETPPGNEPYALTGTPPSPVGVTPPSRPWMPLHLEWSAQWRPSPRGARDWQLGELDYERPAAAAIPPVARTLRGRALLTPAPANLLAGTAQMAARDLVAAGGDGLLGALAAHPAASDAGVAATLADADLLAGSMTGFLDRIRGVPEGELVVGDADADPLVYPVTALRAGLLALTRLRVVDTYGQVVDLAGSSASVPIPAGRVKVSADLVVDGQPGLAAQVPRFTAAARVMLRYTDSEAGEVEVGPGQTPLCGFLIPNPFDATLEFCDSDGASLGRLRSDAVSRSAWEESPGRQATLGRLPGQLLANPALGAIGDAILALDAQGTGQTALSSLLRVIDTTQWTVDLTGKAGDEHLALLLGNPVAVLRAELTLQVDDDLGADAVARTAVAVRLGSLRHLDDGLLGYFVGDDYSRLHTIDPAVTQLAPPLPGAAAGPVANPYIDGSGLLWIQPRQTVKLTLLVTPGGDVRVTTGLLPQKAVGMRRTWLEGGLSRLTPTLRFGPVLRDPKTTRLPVPTDIHGIWAWRRREDASTWASDPVVPATADALLADVPPTLSDGWLRVTLTPEVDFPESAVPIQVMCVEKPSDFVSIKALGGTNRDGSRWRLPIDQAVEFIESGRFRFFVDVGHGPVDLVVDVADSGRKFVRTAGDQTTENNLLSLPRCEPL